MTQTPSGTDRRTRVVAVALVAALHVIVAIGLIRAFTPEFAASVVRTVTQAVDVTLPPPPPPPSPSPAPSRAPPAERGASGAAGRKAVPRDAQAPRAELAVRPTTAPPVAGHGREDLSGATAAGSGTGAGGAGSGTGAGSGGAGKGGGASPTVKMSGEISSAKDYPRKSRDLRIGASVTIDLTVGTDGSVRACRVVRASPDPEADRITCQLATKRFRFRPALGAGGLPVEATYRWTQRWFY